MSGLFITIVIIAIIFLAVLLGNNRLSVSEYRISISGLPKEFDGFTVVQISDLHNKRFGGNQARIMRRIHTIDPDICAITGDFVKNHGKSTQHSLSLFRRLSERQPTYLVTGNHEAESHNWPDLEAAVHQTGVSILRGAIPIQKGDAEIQLIGIDDPAFFAESENLGTQAFEERLRQIISATDGAAPKILLAHRPEMLKLYSSLGIDVVLTGHAHGGLWRFPLIGGLAAPNQGLFPKFTKGVHARGNTSMVISRGLGSTKIPLRIFNPPELVVVRLEN